MDVGLHWVGLIAALLVFLWVDLHFFARGREPGFREAVIWSLGWLALSLLAGGVLLVTDGHERAVEYTTVYLIERSMSLDNLFVFILLFGFFAIPVQDRARLLFYGIILALVLRGLAILGGVALLEQFSWVIYVLGALLILLAYRILRAGDEPGDPDRNLVVRGVRKVIPGASAWLLCLVAIASSDLAFAVDSIPAAFGITRDEFVIWMANVFALMGMRALFVLVQGLIERFRYLDQTIAVVLALVGVKLLIEEWIDIGAVGSLALVLSAFAVGIVASLIGDRRYSSSSTPSGSGSTSS